ncbi:M16 family metallopeptidase [Pedobacter rhodius]|uniref:Insulinase family protein n=1 Tax=Pedobacter rhodius TaxID=3004098 RepID=A0ABT4L487_9SPHI|nr:M16 family metallopeptidase [Pedobacter sp. SJ11]MCZ4224863.1 insulinase family protein [Pedobacter sp. SJ11]
MRIKIIYKIYLASSLLLASIISTSAHGQIRKASIKTKEKSSFPITTNLPLDPNVRTGKLSNGFTYFIRRNTHPKDRVIMYLANKVGSLLENDDQQGLAHFMEHMNFNGTTHFPKNELVDYLQKSGVRFGADINAYTGFDETVYQLPLPSDKPEILRNGIQIMRDWAKGAILDPVEIDKERGVVLEEKRLGKGASQRMQQKIFPVLFNQSRYGQRLPIGLDTILNNFKPATLKQFYNDWYRPNLQALIVVGDIDVVEMEKEIKLKFSDLNNPANERSRTKYTINLTNSNHFVKATDPEETATQVQVLVKREGLVVKTKKYYQDYIVRKLFNSMLGNRFQELMQQKQPPFIAGNAGIGAFIGNIDAFNINVAANPGEIEKGFKAAWREIVRLNRYGFTAAEFDKTKADYIKNVENAYRQKNTNYSDLYIGEYLDYFLRGNAAPGTEWEYRFTKLIMPKITLADVNTLLKEFDTDKNRDIIITAPEKDKAILPDETSINGWMKSVQQEQLAIYKDAFVNKPLLEKIPVGGKIVKQTELNEIKASDLVLSNGVRVILKPTKFSDNDILVKAVAPGGTSLYSDADYESANVAAYLVTSSGLGTYDYNQLNKYLAGSTIASGPYLADYNQGIQAAASPADLETLLQMFYLYFTNPKKDSTAFEKFISQSKGSLANRKNNPENAFYDTLSLVMGNYSPRRTPPGIEKLEQIDLDKSYNIFRQAFSDASNFTFTFVGDFDINKVKPLVEKYLGALPSAYKHEKAKDLGIHPPSGKITKIISAGLEPKATVRLTFSGNYDFGYENNLNMDAIAEVLQIKLIERLREEESGVYAPSVNIRYTKLPAARYSLNISLGCAPSNVDKLIASTLDEINTLKKAGPSVTNIEKFKAEEMRNHETHLRANDFWSEYLDQQALNQDDLTEITKFDSVMKNMTAESVKNAARKYLNESNLIRIILYPEGFKPEVNP